jgi:hypothetical protein
MGRALVAAGTLLALLVGVLVAVSVLGQEEKTLAVDNLLSEEFTREIARAEARGAVVVVAGLTDFAWDRMVLVPPGTPRAAVERGLAAEWTGDVGFRAGELLIFLSAGEVTRFADYRGEGRFAGVRPFASFTPDTAVFTVRDLVIRPR